MRKEYYTNLHSNPSINLRWFTQLIRRVAETGKAVTTREPVPLNGLDYTLYFTPVIIKRENGAINLILKWEDEGESYRQVIGILQERNNLIPNSFVYYFVCPFGYKSRKLFYIANRWRSRRSFRHSYSSQNQSRHQRTFNHNEEPYKRYGKIEYRGELTPYGKRCLRYDQKEQRAEEAFLEYAAKTLARYGD